MKYAAIDVGTNTILLLIVEKEEGTKDVLDISIITRLGQGLKDTGRLSEEAMKRGLDALERYRMIVDEHKVDQTIVVGTSALREATNSDHFLDLVEERTGFKIDIISGREEAYYTFLSVRRDEAIPGEELLILDIGGGSTEIIRSDRREFLDFVSLPIGTVKLTELFVADDPPGRDEMARIKSHVCDLLNLPFEVCNERPTLVGTGGTITNLAAISQELPDYVKEKIHGYRLTVAEVDRLISLMETMTTGERRRMKGMEQGREDIILQGAILLREVMAHFDAPSLIVSAKGVRYGLVDSLR